MRGLGAEGQQRQVHLSFALYSSANPTYVNHQGPVGENVAQFPQSMKVPQRLAACAVNACVYLRPQMFLHYSGLSSKSTSLLFAFVNPARGQNKEEVHS